MGEDVDGVVAAHADGGDPGQLHGVERVVCERTQHGRTGRRAAELKQQIVSQSADTSSEFGRRGGGMSRRRALTELAEAALRGEEDDEALVVGGAGGAAAASGDHRRGLGFRHLASKFTLSLSPPREAWEWSRGGVSWSRGGGNGPRLLPLQGRAKEPISPLFLAAQKRPAWRREQRTTEAGVGPESAGIPAQIDAMTTSRVVSP
mgnify:CR=1 FL=1